MHPRLFARTRAVNIWLMAPLLGLAVFLAVFVSVAAPVATAATSSNLNFQARLFGINGTVVADGTYNIDFKLYNADSTTGSVGTCTGACLWEETRTGSNKVNVINGFFSVNLGSVTAFGSNINWDQPLWLTMNIGGTGASPTWDGEMQNAGHSIALTAIPYSFVAAQLAKTDGSGNRGTLSFNTVANNPNLTLPDVASGTLCVQSSTACGFELTSGTDFIRNQTSAQTANFNVQSAASGSVAAVIQGASGQTADLLDLKNSTTVLSVGNNGQTLFKPTASHNSTTFFQIQSAASSTSVFDVDTTDASVGINTNSPTAVLDVEGAPAGSNNSIIYSSGTSTATSGSQYGQRSSLGVSPTSSSTATFYGIMGLAQGLNANTTGATIIGIDGEADSWTSGNVGTIVGGYFTSNVVSGTAGTSIGVEIPANSVSGTATNVIGEAIGAQTGGTNNTNLLIGTTSAPSGNYSIYNSSSRANYFGGPLTIQTTSNSSTGFVVQDNNGADYIQADTSGAKLYLGNTGIAGTIQIGTTTGAVAQVINIGNNATASSSTSILIGSTVGASSTQIQAGSGGITLSANTSDTGNLDVTGSTALKKGTDFSTTGTTTNASFANASLIRLTGASAQTIDGIANGRDGYLLTLVNAASQAATIVDTSDSSATAANQVVTGTGQDYSLSAGNSIQLVYDASASRWRVVSSSSIGVNTVGTYSSSNHYANGASISGNTITLGSANATNPGLVDTSNQTFAGNKSFSGTLTVAPTTNISSAVIKQTSAASPNSDIFDVQGTNGTSNFIQVTSTAANQGAVSIQSFGSNNITLQAGSGTVSLGTSTTLNASGALTVASGGSSDLTLNSLSGTLKLGSNTTSVLFTDTATATIDAASGSELDLGAAANAHTTKVGSATGAATTTIQSGSGGIGLSGNTTVSGTNTFTVNNGATTLTNSSGTALTVNNSTGANSIVNFQDNGSSVFLVADGGATTISPNQNVASLVVKQTSAASPTADVLDVQNSGGTQNFLSLNLASSTPHLHVYDSGGTNYADIYYSGSQAVFAASSGTTVVGSGTGSVTVQSGSGSGFTVTGDAASSISTNAGVGKDLTIDSGSGTLKFGSNTTTLQKAASSLTLDVSNGASNSTLTVSNSGGAGNITLQLDSGGSFEVGSSVGTTASACSAGQALVGTLVGGIVTSGSCAGFAQTLQDAYNNSTSPATITTSSSTKGVLVKAGASNDSTSLFAVQNSSSSNLLSVDSSDGYVINNGTTSLGNILQNPGFEAGGTTDASGWFTPSASQVITVSSANAHSGNNELQITGNSSTHAVTTKYYAVEPGDQVYAEAWVKNSAGANGDGGIYVEFSDKDKGNAVFTNADTGLPGTSYVLKSITATVPAGKYYVRVAASVKATATTGTFYFDDFYLKRINEQAPLLLTAATSTAFQVQNSSAQTVLGVDASANKLFSGLPDGASAVGFTLNTTNSYSTAGAKLISIQNNGAEKFYIDKDGNVNSSGGLTAGGDIVTSGNANIGSGKLYEINGTQISSSALSNNSDLAKLSGTGPQIFSGNNKFTGTVLAANTSATGFQVQNATVNVLTVDTSGNKTILGTAGGSGLTANLQFNFSGSSGSISLVPLDPSSTNYTLNLPAENGTLCTSAATSTSNCTNFASASSVTSGLNGKLNKNSVDTSAAAVTAVQGDLYAFTNNSSNIASGVLKLNNGNNTGNALYVTGTNDYSTGSAYIVVNNTNAGPTGNLIDLQSNAADEFTVDAAGNVFANGNINIATGKLYEINGTQISTSALSDGGQIAKLNATQTFSGANTFSNASNSFTGDGSNLTNLNASNVATGTLNDGRLSSNVALLNRSGQTFTGDNTFAPTNNGAGTTIKQTSGTATSGSILDVQTADGTGHFLQITNAAANQGAVTLQSIGATSALTLGSASGTLSITAATGTIQHNNSSLTIDVNNGSDSTFSILNSQGGAVASLSVEGDAAVGAGRVYKVGTTSGVGVSCGSNTYLQNATSSGGIITGGNCANAVNSISAAGGSIANGASISGNALTLGYADTSNPGLVSNSAQSFNGAKTFVNDTAVKDTSTTAFQVQNSSGVGVLVVDTSNRQLKVMENAGSTNYSLIYYDTATSTANYTASAGTVAVGLGAGAISVTAGSSSAVTITANASSTWKTTAGTLTLQSGTGTSDFLILNAGGSGQVQVNGSATVKLGSATSDPTCTNGAIYYNTTLSSFRGCQGGSWATLSAPTPSLQTAYTNSTGGTTPEIKVDSTRGAVDIQDADSTINGVIFAVRGTNAGGLGTSLLNVNTSNNTVNIGTSATSTALLVLGSDTNSTFNQGTASNVPGTVVNGAMFYSSTDHNFLCGQAGAWLSCNGLLYSNTSAGSQISTCTTACNALASAPIPANYCQAGRVINLNASGIYSTSATTIQFGIYWGNNSAKASDQLLGGASGTQSQVSSSVAASSWTWQLQYTVTCFSSTTMMLQGYEILQEAAAAAGTSMKVYALPISATTTVTTNASGYSLYVFPAFGASAAGDNATMEQMVVTGN